MPSLPASWSDEITQNACNMDFGKLKEKYGKYFDGNRIFPIPELVEQVKPKTVSFVITDLKTRRLAGIKKETFEELLKGAGIPAKYYCRCSFATWDVLLPSQELAAKLAGESINSKFFRLQPEYMGRRRIRVTVCNVPIELNEEVLAAYLCKHGDIENIIKAKSSTGTAHGDYVFTMCLDRGGFGTIPHTIENETQVMTVVVEGRKPQCWNCKQLGHFFKSCPQKIMQPGQTVATTAVAAAATTSSTKATATVACESPNAETGDHPNKDEEGWTQVQKGKQKKASAKANTTTTVITKTTEKQQQQQPSSAVAKTQHTSNPSSSTVIQKKTKDIPESMEVAVNLKRRRDSGDSQKDGGEKKHIKDNKVHPQTPSQSQKKGEQSQTPSQSQKKGEQSQTPSQSQSKHPQTPSQSQPKGDENTKKSLVKPERPAQLIPLPQQSKSTPTDDFPLSPQSPSLSPITTPKLITRSHSVTRASTPSPSATKQRSQSVSSEMRRATNAFYFCEDILEPQHLDHVLKKALKPLLALKTIEKKDITNPYNFQNVPMLTTFVRAAGNRTKELWLFIEEASRADVMLADTTNAMLQKMLPYCAGRVPILVHPSFYRSLKLRYPMDVGGITRDDRVSTELGTESLRQAVGILTPKDFRPVVDSE